MLYCVEKSEEPNTDGREPLTESRGRMPCKPEEQHKEMQIGNKNFSVDSNSYICMTTSHPQ